MNSSNIESKLGGLHPGFLAMLMAGSVNANAAPAHYGPDLVRYSYAQNVRVERSGVAAWRSSWSESFDDSNNRSKKAPAVYPLDDDWARIRQLVAQAGIDIDSSEVVYRLARKFAVTRGIRITEVQGRVSVDPEEGISYAAIRLMTDIDFDAAMEADWEMAAEILDGQDFPENLTVSLRSIA